jgi:hypothetical protein
MNPRSSSRRCPFAPPPVFLALLTVLLGPGPACTSDTGFLTTDSFIGENGVGIDAIPDTRSVDAPLQLVVSPSNSTIFIDTSKTNTPATLTYKVTIGSRDVSSKATFSIDPTTLGTFKGPAFTSALTLPGGALGYTGKVKVTAEGNSTSAKLTIVKLRKTADSNGKRDFYFVVPYKKTPDPTTDTLKFSTDIQKVDVAFIMDTTGSMSGAISNLKNSLSTTIIPGLSSIPSVGFAVVDHRDWGDSWVVKVRQIITTSTSATTAAVSAMSAGEGGDTDEAQLAAMHFTLTGQANTSGGQTIAAHTPATGTTGGVDFRKGAVPVLVLITDAPWHDPSGSATATNVTAAFKSASARFVSILASTSVFTQPNTLSDATSSALATSAFAGKCGTGMCCTDLNGGGKSPDAPSGKCRLNFLTNSSGTGVSSSITAAIQAISVGSTYDIWAKTSNDSTNPGGVDATKFIKSIRAMEAGDTKNSCSANTAKDTDSDGVKDTFESVLVGTPICFELIPKMNETVQATESAQFFIAYINMIGDPGTVDLGDKRTIVFLVPPKDPILQ